MHSPADVEAGLRPPKGGMRSPPDQAGRRERQQLVLSQLVKASQPAISPGKAVNMPHEHISSVSLNSLEGEQVPKPRLRSLKDPLSIPLARAAERTLFRPKPGAAASAFCTVAW